MLPIAILVQPTRTTKENIWRVIHRTTDFLSFRTQSIVYSHRFPANYTFPVEPSAMIQRISPRHHVFHRL